MKLCSTISKAFLIVILFASCREEAGVPEFAPDPPGVWLKGDLHVHSSGASNDTDGMSWPSQIKHTATERGLDFLVLTDHSNSTGSDPSTTDEDPGLFNMGNEFTWWDSSALLSNVVFRMITGNEISPRQQEAFILNPTGHIGCIPPDLSTFDTSVAFVDRPFGTVSGGDALNQAIDAGCYTVLFHPYAAAPWIKYDWSAYGYDAIEVWNGTGGFDINDERSYAAWICDLLSGREITAIGGSDNHRISIPAPGGGTDPALGFPFTWVFAQSTDWVDVIAGLRAGRTAVGEGGSALFLDAYDSEGLSVEQISNGQWIRFRGTVDALAENPQIVLRQYLSCVDPRPNHLGEYSFEKLEYESYSLTAGETFDFALKIENAQAGSVFAAHLTTDTEHYHALSGAIRAE